MACASCATGGCGSIRSKNKSAVVSGCKNNGACGTGGCNKMNVFDWLSDMEAPGLGIPQTQRSNLVEVKFKGGRKEYFRNISQLELYTGDPVVVEMSSGHHLGFISLQGELVRLQIVKRGVKEADIRQVYRKATPKDLEKHEQTIARDLPTMYRAREIVKSLDLNMKLSDVEFQSDGTKATFFYSSDERVDFRELIKVLAGEFKVRIEMKQISLRQEAARIGGIGVCGRELCCSTWLTDFKNVTTSAARYQNLSLNPVKLSGQCGRLKCCLNYELETYMDALRDIPSLEGPVKIQKGDATLQKTDIFRKIMWFGFRGEDNWYPVPIPQVLRIVELNKKGVIPPSFEELEAAPVTPQTKAPALNSDLEQMDRKYQSKNRSPKNKKKRGGGGGRPPQNNNKG
ncbi:PSP1 domain-containing protein [Siphonobacter aquaeclarae]|uniref:Cell fate regulator YaaT, PSP1 superfamily (Controls sporulation, competence, biofilm development) n=1 Tax=Siphonobacter aquaeclarae TaxID=563176 RepID=A0A1G9MVI1_9BACT|nr:Cell fate regulator YaaT, PSP1 superfamily (controls sporulation, competence, biofilm development) [Siphonobacter aquaeclarae]